MYSISNRIKLYNSYKDIFYNKTYKRDLFQKISVLGQGGQGKVYKYCSKNNCKDNLAIKKIYIDKKQSKYIDDIFNIKAFKFGIFIELSSYYFINELVFQKISPNFILNYGHEFIDRTGICNDIYPYSGYFYNEYVSNSQLYTEWVKQEHTLHLWYNGFFQITTAIYALQKHFNMTHLDLHSDNILVKQVKPGGYWTYIINNLVYKVPNLGYIFYINDFGHAFIPNVFQSWFATQRYNRKAIHKGFDIYQLFKSTLKISTSPAKFKSDIRYIIKQLKNNNDFNEVIEHIWSDRYVYDTSSGKIKTLNTKNIETYNLDAKISTKNIPKALRVYI